MVYFNSLQGFDEKTTLEVALNLDEEGESSQVWGLRVSTSEETIASVCGLSCIGQRWFKLKIAMPGFLEEFLVGDEIVRTNRKGYNHAALPQPWDDVALFIQKYITCEGWYMTVFRQHFKVMASLPFLVPDYALNMPFYLKSTLNWMSWLAKRDRSPVVSLTNHGLVRLLIINALLQMLVTWLQFIELPSNELTKMLTLQPANIEEIGAILPEQEANAKRIEDQREEDDQVNNQDKVTEPTEKT